MSWIFPCPACDHPIRPRPAQRGQWVRCPMCQHRLQIPAVIGEEALSKQPLAAASATTSETSGSPSGVFEQSPNAPVRSTASASGFWRGLVAGVGFVVLVAVVALGIRGQWPSRLVVPNIPEMPDGQLNDALSSRPPQGMGERSRPPEPPRDALNTQECVDHPIALTVRPPLGGVNSLPVVAKLPSFLAMVTASRTGHLLLSNSQSELRLYRQKDLQLLAQVILRGPAYAMALDETTGRLFAAISRTGQTKVDHLKGRETTPADLHVYDVSPLLQEKMLLSAYLKPVQEYPLGAAIQSLVLSKDGKQLICISESGREAQIHRFRTDLLNKPEVRPLRLGPSQSLSLSPSGNRLFVLANGQVTAYELGNWQETGRVTVGLNLFSPVAIDDERLLLLERQASWLVVAVDVPQRKALSRWELGGIEGRPSLVYSPQTQRVYVAGSGVLYGQVWELDCAADKLQRPVWTRHLQAGHDRLLRGPLHLSHDGRYVLLGNGVVLGGA